MSEPTDLPPYASDYPAKAVLRDYVDPDSGLRMLVVRGPLSYCAYVGVKADHTLAGLEELQFPCHHGITFCSWGMSDSYWAEDFFWWGWDYAHFSDHIDEDWSLLVQAPVEEMSLLDDASAELRRAMLELKEHLSALTRFPGKNWTLGEVVEDALDVMMGLKQSLLVSEQYAALVLKR